MSNLLSELRDVAIDAAHHSGRILVASVTGARAEIGTKSTGTDMVTEMDRASERLVEQAIRDRRPGDALIGEEGASITGSSGVRWIVDPLDGTTNYLYTIPAYAVSIAAEVDGEVAVGVVHDPSHAETFSAIRGEGAYLGADRLSVDGAPPLAEALVGTGFSYDPRRRTWQASVLAGLLGEVRDVRRFGAAALDLCWVAAGRLDVFYERGLNLWDYAAGALIAAEADACVGDLDGGPPSSDIVLAAVPSVHDEFAALLRRAEGAADPAG